MSGEIAAASDSGGNGTPDAGPWRFVLQRLDDLKELHAQSVRRMDGLEHSLGELRRELKDEIYRLDVKIDRVADSSTVWSIGILLSILALIFKLFLPTS